MYFINKVHSYHKRVMTWNMYCIVFVPVVHKLVHFQSKLLSVMSNCCDEVVLLSGKELGGQAENSYIFR